MADPARKFVWDEWPVEQFTQKLHELFGQNPTRRVQRSSRPPEVSPRH